MTTITNKTVIVANGLGW